MDIRILEDKKSSLVFEIDGVSHGFLNALKEQLTRDKNVKLATYRNDHPLVGHPRMKIESDDPHAALKKAVKELRLEVTAFKKDIVKLK